MKYLPDGLAAAFVALSLVGTLPEASAQVRAQARVGGNRVSYSTYGRRPWFRNDGVRRQLKLDDAQYDTLSKGYVEHWTPYNQAVVGLPADLEETQRQQRIAAAYGTFHKGFNDTTAKVFVDPDTRNRYNQLHLQYQGYGAFNDPTVQERLRLTKEQQQNFNRYNADWQKQMNTYAGEYATTPETVNKQWGDYWKKTRSQINETLTPEQRKSWNEMTGEAYDFPADVYFDEGDDDRDNPRRDNPRRDDAPRNPAPGAGPRENPPKNPAPGAGPRENPPRNPAPANPK